MPNNHRRTEDDERKWRRVMFWWWFGRNMMPLIALALMAWLGVIWWFDLK